MKRTDFGEPWKMDGDFIVSRYGSIVDCKPLPLGLSLEFRERILACVNLCAGLSTELIASPNFGVLIQRAAKVFGEDLAEPIKAEERAGADERLIRDARQAFSQGGIDGTCAEIEAIVEKVLRRHGIVAPEKARRECNCELCSARKAREASAALSEEGKANRPRHIHTLTCYDGDGNLLCGGAR